MRRFFRGLLRFIAVAYPLAVAAVWLALTLVGETWWPTTIALYLPRVVWALPLPLIVLALLVWGPRRLLLLQAAAAAMLLFPIMGLTLGSSSTPRQTARLRILSFNINYGWTSEKEIKAELAAANPDIIVLQAAYERNVGFLAKALAGYQMRQFAEFVVASRYPFLETADSPGGHPAFFRATLDTPLGVIDVFTTHPLSPRGGFEAIRGAGLREGLESGRVLRGEGSQSIAENTAIRAHQVQEVAAAAAAAAHPVIIAGDTNLPVLSRLYREQLGRWQDGWSEVGLGFGHTYPAHHSFPWMRIDRILAGPQFRFLRFEVGRRRASDHYAVWADLELR